MIEFSDIKGKYIGNKNLINNVLGSFLVRGFGFLVSFALFPLYLNYFDDNTVLGCKHEEAGCQGENRFIHF